MKSNKEKDEKCNMYKAEPKDYLNYIQCIDESSCGAVYPYSIAEGFQSGDIFSDSSSVLFWHYSGFAFIYGNPDERFLKDISALLLNDKSDNPRRFILFTADSYVESYFRKSENVDVGRRIFFEYGRNEPSFDFALPAGYDLRELDDELLGKLNGSVTPFFSWDNPTDFLNIGKGFCAVDRNNAASWAFAAAISSKEIDIGIETALEYQHLGLAAAVAEKMMEYCFEQQKRPVWACRADNIASKKLAEKLGFVKTSECWTIGKSNQ